MTPFIQMLHDAILAQAKLEQKKQHRQCHFCKSTLGDIHANGKVGCAMCYDVFADELNPLIELVQNPMKVSDLHHIGKTPKSIHDEVIINFLEQELILRLQKAIKLEKYEEAALLNKKTKELDVYKTEKKDIIKFIKRALEFGEYEGINVGRDKINDLYLRLRNDFSLYIP